MIKVVGNRSVLEIIALFIIVLVLGLMISVAAVATSKAAVLEHSLASSQFTYFTYMLDIIIIATLLLMVFRRKHGVRIPFMIFEGIIVSFTCFLVFALLTEMLLPQYDVNTNLFIAAIFAVGLSVVKNRHARLRDTATMFSSMGVGIVLGLNFTLSYAMLIMAALAVYDYIAVFRTKYMVALEKAYTGLNAAFLISASDVEAIPKSYFTQKEVKDYKSYLAKSKGRDDERYKRIMAMGEMPVLSQISLGEGDLSIPLMVTISAYTTISYVFGYAALTGSVAGIFATMLFLKRYKSPLPAIPPLFSFISIALGAAFLATGAAPIYTGFLLITVGVLIVVFAVALTIWSKSRSRKRGM